MSLPTQCVIRWPMVYLRGYRSLSPERMQGNGSENWVHQAEHLLAKCKQTEMGSSPITGAAASKNNPVAQQLRNPVWAVSSAAKQLWQERQSILPRHARICFFKESAAWYWACGKPVYHIAMWAGWYVLLQICWGLRVGALGNHYYFISVHTFY